MLNYIVRRFYGAINVDKIKINDILNKKISQPNAVIKGWVRSVRKHKHVVFLDVNDGSTMQCLQVVLAPVNFKSGISYGASVCCSGKIISTKKHVGGIEMDCNEVELVGPCTEDFAFNKHANHYPQFLRQFPHLRPKEDSMLAVLRTRSALEMEIHRYFQEKQFLHVHTPTLTSSDCEGAGETFSVSTDVFSEEPEDYHEEMEEAFHVPPSESLEAQPVLESKSFFGTPVFLTVSGQLQLEACAAGVGDVYTLGPVFRAEKGGSRKHLSEFRMLEVEMAFTQSLDCTMDVMEDSIRSFIRSVSEKCNLELQHFFNNDRENYMNIVDKAKSDSYIRLSYRDALEVLKRYSDRVKTFVPNWGDDFNNEHENLLMEYTDNCPLFITDFPKHSKPFYMYENLDDDTNCLPRPPSRGKGRKVSFRKTQQNGFPKDTTKVSAVDLIFPFCGELCGGSVREHRVELLQERLEKLEMRNQYEWYLDLRRYGNTPHAGYGMGFDRLVRFLMGLNDIRDAVPFPRVPRSCVL